MNHSNNNHRTFNSAAQRVLNNIDSSFSSPNTSITYNSSSHVKTLSDYAHMTFNEMKSNMNINNNNNNNNNNHNHNHNHNNSWSYSNPGVSISVSHNNYRPSNSGINNALEAIQSVRNANNRSHTAQLRALDLLSNYHYNNYSNNDLMNEFFTDFDNSDMNFPNNSINIRINRIHSNGSNSNSSRTVNHNNFNHNEGEFYEIPLDYDTLIRLDNSVRKVGISDSMKKKLKTKYTLLANYNHIHNSQECSVCLEQFILGNELILLQCKHGFHSKCILTWLETSKTCPICRSPIT